jgi:hypothetical protein
MKITKVLAILLALITPFTLTACGDEVEVEEGEVED